MNSIRLKEAYDIEAEYKAFYTGGHIEWTSNGERMLCQCDDAINSIDLSTGLVASTFGGSEEPGSEDQVYCFTLSRDNCYLASAHKSGLIKYWSVDDVKVVKLWRSIHKGPISKLAFSRDGNVLATGGSDGTAKLWNIHKNTCTHSLKGAQGVFSILTFHPDVKRDLIFGSADDSKIFSWDTVKGTQKKVFTGHFSKVTSLSFTIDGSQMVTSGRDRVLILWDIEQGNAIRTLPVYESVEGAVVLPIKFHLPDIKVKKSDGGVYVACAGEKGIIKVWELTKSKLVYTQNNSVVSPATEDGGIAVTQLLLNEVRSCLSVVSVDHNIIVYDLATFDCYKQMVGFTDEILDVTFVGSEDTHLAVASNSPDIKVYELATMNCQLVKGHADFVVSLQRSPGNFNLFLSSSKDNTIRIWLVNPENYNINCVAVGNRHTSSVGSVCMPVMDCSFCFSVSQDNCIKRWLLPTFEDSAETVSLTCSHTEVAHSKDINYVTVSPNDKVVASASQDKTIRLWSADDLSSLGTLRGHKRGVWCVRFSPVDQVLVSASADCSIKLWSLAELSCLKTLEGHSSSVLRVDFLSRGMQIVSTSADGLLKIWNIKTSEATVTLDKHEGRVWAMAVSQSEKTIITGDADSLLVKWKDVTVEKREREAKEREEMIMQEQELSNLLHEKKLVKALKLALKLDKPLNALKIINELLKDEDDQELLKALNRLNANDVDALLKFCIEWNTNTKNCHVAQIVLNTIIKDDTTRIRNASTVRTLLPYTQKHMQRVTEQLQDLQFLDFTINCMKPHITKMS